MSAHTKGLWQSAARQGDDWLSVVYVPGTPYEICQCFHDDDKDECEANARLIAAAQKDAERYRWLREEWSNRKWRHVPIGHGDELDGDDITFPDTIDAAIDAAMEKAK